MTAGLFVVFIWVLVFISVTILQSQFEQVLPDWQFASAQRLAAEFDNKLKERLEALVGVAANMPSNLTPQALDIFLGQWRALHPLFSAGIAVIGLDGKTIADSPIVPGRRGTFMGDRDYVRQVVASGKTYVDKPIMDRAMKRPVLTIAVPVFDNNGKLRAVMTGITDLTSPNVIAALPTEIAFGPVKTMQVYLYVVAGILTLFAFFMMLWVTRRMLRPLEDAGKAIRNMTKGEMPLVPLPVQRKDEVGQMIGDFNLLIEGRQRIERELRKREEEFRALVENSPDIVARFDQEFRCLYANPAFQRTTGLPSDQVIGKTAKEMRLPQNFVSMWTASIDKVVGIRDADTFEFSFPTPAGDRYYQVRMVPEFGVDGDVPNVLAVARDISAIKGGEAILRESEQRIHGITANTPGMVFQCRLRSRDGALLFTYVSEGSKTLLGLTPSQIQANRRAIPDCLVESDRAAFHESLRNSVLTMEVWNWEGRTLPADGEEKWINCRATPRFSSEGDVIWEGVMLNITDCKRSEEEIRQSRQLLRELSAHRENVREEERKRIAREVHDELGQTLTVLRMDVSLLRLNLGSQNLQLLERIQSMKEVVDRTIQIVRHVTSTLRPVALDLGLTAALEWQVEQFISHAESNCRLKTIGCDEVVLDDNRATALFRIVQESLTNVAKHAEASEVEILIELRSYENLFLRISDNGKGFVTDGVRKAGSFGLIGIRERTLILGGTLAIHSAPGQGTQIEICIPLEVQGNTLERVIN